MTVLIVSLLTFGYFFPRAQYAIAIPIMGLVTGGFFWGVFGLAGWIPGTGQSFGLCVLVGAAAWSLLFYVAR